jgi:hypothetical protein
MTAMWASRHADLVSAGGVFPHVCDHMVVPPLGVVLDRCHPLGSAVDAGLNATACALRAARAADGGIVYVQHALQVSPRAPPMKAQRVGSIVPFSYP